MRYRITHQTEYTYAMPVSVGHNQVFLRPRDLPHQHCVEHAVNVEPAPGISNLRTDFFGNQTMLFTVQEPHTRMLVTSISEVDVTPRQPPPPGISPPWNRVREAVRKDNSPAGLAALQFAFNSPQVAMFPEATEYARQSFPEGRPILEATLDLTHRIFKDFKYDPTTTTISTPVQQVFSQRSGVCQDFAHLQIAMLRGLGLPARYVSGYLRTFHNEDDPKLIGADASHAWLAVYAGSGDPAADGWTDFDPTNDLVPGEHHIAVAYGRDYADVSPVKGVIIGGGDQTIKVRVCVKPVESQG